MPAASTTMNLDEIAARLRHGVGRLARRLRREGAEGGTGQPQLSALTAIERHRTMTMGALSTHEQGWWRRASSPARPTRSTAGSRG
jgi:hypothetical protein